MSTGITYTKGGTVIQCDTSILPRPRPQMAWPIPVFPGTSQSFLALALQAVTNSGTNAVLVTTPAALPGSSAGVWTLYWYSYQGSTAPVSPSWNSVPVPATGLGTGLLLTPPNASTVICYLQRVEAGQTSVYGQVNIATPADLTVPTVNQANSADYLVNADKMALMSSWATELATQTQLDASAAAMVPAASHTAYDAAVTALSTGLISSGAPANWASTWPDGTTSGPWTGIKSSLKTWWAAIATARAALQASIVAVPGNFTAQQNSLSYLTNSDKISLMGQWAAEASTKTALDAQATAASVSSTAYDNAVSNLSTQLIAAGAPANWATIWPDGTTSGPWTNIQTSLSNLWATIATQRATLQRSISAAGESAAQAAAISAAATDATSKMSTATTTALAQAPTLVAGLPGLPNASYPVNKMVFDSVTNRLYTNVANVWKASTATVPSTDITGQLADAQVAALSASKVTGQMTDSQLAGVSAAKLIGTVGIGQIGTGAVQGVNMAGGAITASSMADPSSTNLIPNGNSELPAPTGGWPSGAYEAAGLVTNTGAGHNGSNHYRQNSAGNGWTKLSPTIPCIGGEQYYYQAFMMAAGGGTATIAIDCFDASGNWISASSYPSTSAGVWTPVIGNYTTPGNAAFLTFSFASMGSGQAYIDDMYLCKVAVAGMLAANSVVAGNIAANSICAQNLTLTNLDNLIPNPNSNMPAPTGGWPSGALEQAGYTYIGGYGYGRQVIGGGSGAMLTGFIPVKAGDMFYLQADCFTNGGAGTGSLRIEESNASQVSTSWPWQFSPQTGAITTMSATYTVPAGVYFLRVYIQPDGLSSGVGAYFNNFYMRRMADANLIVDGSISATKMAVNSITAANAAIADLAVTNAKIASLDAGKITTGYLAAGIIQAGSLDASKITAGTVTSDRMTANSITGDRIQANSLDASKITANTITAGQISAGAIGANQIAANSIMAGNMTISNLDNLVPNPNSSQNNGSWPSGAIEANYLMNMSGYGWCRGLQGSQSVLYMLTNFIPVKPGDKFFIQADCYCTGGSWRGMLHFEESNTGGATGWPGLITSNNDGLMTTRTATYTVPAGVQFLRLYIWKDGMAATDSTYWNNFYVRRMADANLIVDGSVLTQKLAANAVMTSNFTTDTGQTASSLGNTGIPSGNPTSGAWLGVGSSNPIWVGPGGMRVGAQNYGGSYSSYSLDASVVMSFNVVRTNYSSSAPPANPRFWYAGNNDGTTNGGAPNLGRLTATPTVWDTTNHIVWLDLAVAPSSLSDNLDSLRYATVQFYLQSAAGTKGTLTAVGPLFKIPLADRLYFNANSDGDAGNVATVTASAVHSGVSGGVPAAIITLYNAAGPSASNCYYSAAGWAAGTALINNGTSFPSGLAGGGSGGTGGGGGGHIGCVPAGTPLLMADGTWMPIEQAGIGMDVAAWDDQSLQPVPARISKAFVFKERALWRIVTADGEIVCSHDHRILQGAAWVPAREAVVGIPTLWRLTTGELVYSTILEATPTGELATVYHVGLDHGHVYCAGAILAHNMKAPTF